MKISGKSIRPFIGSKNYSISRNFYQDLEFEEIITSEKMSYFSVGNLDFIYKMLMQKFGLTTQ